MKRKEEPRKRCDNCKHFIMHFYRSRYNYWVAGGCGECKIKKFTEEERAKLPYNFVCVKWEGYENRDKIELKNELFDISARLKLIIKELLKQEN